MTSTTRRAALLGGATTLGAATLGAATIGSAAGAPPSLGNIGPVKAPTGPLPGFDPWTSYQLLLGETADNFALAHAAWVKKGWRTRSLAGYGAPGAMRFVAVMALDPGAPGESFIPPTDSAAFGLKTYELNKTGWRLVHVAATGGFGEARFAGVVRSGGPETKSVGNASPEQFRATCFDYAAKGFTLIAADSYGSPTTPLFAGVFAPSEGPAAWSADGAGETTALLQARFDALVPTGARPALVTLGPGDMNLMTFTDGAVGAFAARGSLSADALDAFLATERKARRAPISIGADETPAGPRFSVVTSDRAKPKERVFRAKGPTPVMSAAAVAAIDAGMEAFLKSDRLRGAALAVTRGGKLVFAKGYTLAEADYPDVLPTTVFRQASVSKMFVATALHRVFQNANGAFGLDTKLQDVLAIEPPPGADFPSKDNYGAITLRHLLESRSGLRQDAIYWSGAAAEQFGLADAPSAGQLMRYAAQYPTTGAPGDPKNVVYGNYDYLLLGQVLRKIVGAPTLDAALKTVLLDPLKMTRTRSSRALLKDQPADEARYHMAVAAPTANDQHPLRALRRLGRADGAIVPEQYGALDYEIFGGCGGLSAAVVDVARLGAAFSVTTSNPILSNTTIQSIKDLVLAAQTGASSPYPNSAHGYHGFDYLDGFGALQKGGWLWSHESWTYFLPGGFGFTIAANGNKFPGGGGDWLTPVVNACLAETWTDADLFPAFGMPTMGAFTANPKIADAAKVLTPAKTIALTGADMQRAASASARRPPLRRAPR